MFAVRSFSGHSHLHFRHYRPTKPSLISISIFVINQHNLHTTAPKDPILYNYLIQTFNLPKSRALATSNRLRGLKSLEKPKSVVDFFRSIGFSNTQIQTLVLGSPRLLAADINKTLKPKIDLIQELGLSGNDLGNFLSKRHDLLSRSLDKVIRPTIAVLKDTLGNDIDNRDLFSILRRCSWVYSKSPELRFKPNVEFLKSCGIVGSQLPMLLRRQPSIFSLPPTKLKELVSKVLDLGFLIDSRMLAHGVHSVSCISNGTYRKKLDCLKSFGFEEKECVAMIRKSPTLLRTSEEKLRLGIEFYVNTVGVEKSILLSRPSMLMFSLEKRVLPRYRVLSRVRTKKLLKKELSLFEALYASEDRFLNKYVVRFPEHAEELLLAYKGYLRS